MKCSLHNTPVCDYLNVSEFCYRSVPIIRYFQQRPNTKSNTIYKQNNSTSLKVKQRCRTILNLEEKVRWAYVKCDLFNLIT